MKQFAGILRELRKERHLPQAVLAKALYICQSTIAYWECGKREPTATNIIAIADYFDVSTDYLLGRTEY